MIQPIANHIALRRPSQSPSMKLMMHPAKHPRSYMDAMMPVRLSLGSIPESVQNFNSARKRCSLFMVLRKSLLPTMPLKTPWWYPVRRLIRFVLAKCRRRSRTEENESHLANHDYPELQMQTTLEHMDLHLCKPPNTQSTVRR
jgi:hypothetical protein